MSKYRIHKKSTKLKKNYKKINFYGKIVPYIKSNCQFFIGKAWAKYLQYSNTKLERNITGKNYFCNDWSQYSK